MQERNIINGVMTTALAPFIEFYGKLLPFCVLGFVLIIIDYRFGVAKARVRGEEVRTSRAIRRTFNKIVDYICWITLSGLFGESFGEILGIPILATLMLLIIYVIEVNSCYNNYFEARGIKKRINIFKLFRRPEVEQCIDENQKE